MKKNLLIILLSASVSLFADAPTMQTIVGKWQNDNYSFTLNSSYKATIIIMANRYESFVFNGIYTIEKDYTLRISISEMKSCPPGEILSRKGFTKTASSRFIFNTQIKNDKQKLLILKPKEIIIDGNNSEGYFEPVLNLPKR